MKKKSRKGKFVHVDDFEGYVGLLTVDAVSEPQIWDYNGTKITVLDAGYMWLSIMGAGDLERFAISATE